MLSLCLMGGLIAIAIWVMVLLTPPSPPAIRDWRCTRCGARKSELIRLGVPRYQTMCRAVRGEACPLTPEF